MATILVVDDDPDFVEVIRTILMTEGYEVTTASNGEKAIAAIRKEQPDLVLLDIMMAYVLDGINVVRQVRMDPAYKDLPILVISSLTGVQTTEMYPSDQGVDIDGWISKPVQPKELLERVQTLLERDRV